MSTVTILDQFALLNDYVRESHCPECGAEPNEECNPLISPEEIVGDHEYYRIITDGLLPANSRAYQQHAMRMDLGVARYEQQFGLDLERLHAMTLRCWSQEQRTTS